MGNNGYHEEETDLMDLPDTIEDEAELKAVFPGARIDAEGLLKRGNGILTGGDQQQYRSLMKSLISHVKTGDQLLDLIQELKVGNYLTTKEADLVTDAIIENWEVQNNLAGIMIWVINRGSVNNNSVSNVIKGLTHTSTSFTSNRQNWGWGKKKNGNTSSQISQ